MSVEYVVATTAAPRSRSCPEAIADPWWYLKQHVHSLERLNHNLDLITVIVNGWDRLPDLPTKVKDTSLRVLQRDNVGMSYGAFELAARATEHDQLIFCEDDYVYCIDDFDQIVAAGSANEKFFCGAVWSWGWRTPGFWGDPTEEQPIAAWFGGMLPTASVRAALKQGWFGKPPVLHESAYAYGCFNQIRLSQALHQSGCELVDWLDTYSTAYWDGEKIRLYARSETAFARAMVVPLQTVGRSTRVEYLNPPHSEAEVPPTPIRRCTFTVHEDGVFPGIPPRSSHAPR